MKDEKDTKTLDLVGEPARGRGRPALYHSEEEKKAARAAAARQRRAREKAERDARRRSDQPLTSDILDLSQVGAWRTRTK